MTADMETLLVLDRIATALERLVKIECLRQDATVEILEASYTERVKAEETPAPPPELLTQTEDEIVDAGVRLEELRRRGYELPDDADLDDPALQDLLEMDARRERG